MLDNFQMFATEHTQSKQSQSFFSIINKFTCRRVFVRILLATNRSCRRHSLIAKRIKCEPSEHEIPILYNTEYTDNTSYRTVRIRIKSGRHDLP